jgi:hypothetical protein
MSKFINAQKRKIKSELKRSWNRKINYRRIPLWQWVIILWCVGWLLAVLP